MGLKEKVVSALQSSFNLQDINLDDSEGISGYIVSDQFADMSSFDRQTLLYRFFRSKTHPVRFTKAELEKIYLIACLSPAEFYSIHPQKKKTKKGKRS